MIQRSTRLQLRRSVRKRRKQVEDIGATADEQLDRHFIRRLVRLMAVRRFVLGWLGLMILLIVAVAMQTSALRKHFQVSVAASGGIYSEGILGSYTNSNPLYAVGSVDGSVSRLIFASLLKYDDNHQLVGDLAEKWSVDETEKIYTVTLRPELVWQDGQPLTAKDVVFTYKTIQNPDAKSYLQASWQGIEISAKDDRTIIFKLPSQLSAFSHSLTTGIIPEHILGPVPASQLRSSDFNTIGAVGAGPFRFEAVDVSGDNAANRQEQIALAPFNRYHNGAPRLDRFVVKTFRNEKQMTDSYAAKQINAMTGLTTIPEEFAADDTTIQFGIPVMAQVMVFFKTTQGVLKDPNVRQALVLAADKKETFAQVPYSLIATNGPVLHSHTSYDAMLVQITGDRNKANQLLDQAGWIKDPNNGIRSKDGAPLTFRLYAQAKSEYASVTDALQKQWRAVGVDVQIVQQSEQDLKSTVSTHSYDALIDAISLGPDPDVFAYWHSSQADIRSATRLNFSEYNSPVADKALEAGRTRSDRAVRKVKYQPFLEVWRTDAPALALYQPRFLYVVRTPLHGFDVRSVVIATDRYAHVENWTIRESKATYTPDLRDRL